MEPKATILDTLQAGQLPELPISLETSTILTLSGCLFLVGLILILLAKAINK